jgi:hypothetical protein
VTCVHCRYRPVLRSWRQLAIIVKACRHQKLCLDCYAQASLRQGYRMAEAFLHANPVACEAEEKP